MTKQTDTPLNERYAKQRLMRILTDMVEADQLLSWSALASDISVSRGVEFSRENLRRLRKGTLGPANVEIIIQYLEESRDPNIRERLRPDAIFDELAKPARDYYFHIPEPNDISEWNEQILDEFSGVYFCEPAAEIESFMPTSYLREWLTEESRHNKAGEIDEGRLNIFLQRRTILILQKTAFGYFYAAELPLSALATSNLKSSCQRVLYEGIGVVSSNTIQVKLRDCLTRVAKTHSIALVRKYAKSYDNPFDLALHVFHNQQKVIKKWQDLSADNIAALQEEQKLSIQSEYFMQGPVSEPAPPLPNRKSYISMIIANEYIYFKKPEDFLENLDLHFVLSHMSDDITIRKILENPLVIGTLT